MNGPRQPIPATPRILLIEDDAAVADTLKLTLGEFGFDMRWCANAAAARAALASGMRPDLSIVDLGLPDADGVELIEWLRAESGGVLVLTGRGFLSDRVAGLERGADDYMVKPFEPRELVARVRSILRRAGLADPGRASGAMRRRALFSGFSFDPESLGLTDVHGSSIQLSSAEARLLEHFLRAPQRVLSREQLLDGRDSGPFDRSIDVRVSKLRKRLRDDPHEPRLIKTVYGAGYLFAASVSWEDVPA